MTVVVCASNNLQFICVSGLYEAQGLHSHSGPDAQHLRRFLEDGLGTELCCHSDDHETGGKNQGKRERNVFCRRGKPIKEGHGQKTFNMQN